jgi:hypothetical protein
MSAELTPEQIAAWGKASRAASGVPPKIQDPAAIARLITLAFAGTDHDGTEDGGGPPVRPTAPRRRKPLRKKAAS